MSIGGTVEEMGQKRWRSPNYVFAEILLGMKHQKVEISGDVTDAGRTTTMRNKQRDAEPPIMCLLKYCLG